MSCGRRVPASTTVADGGVVQRGLQVGHLRGIQRRLARTRFDASIHTNTEKVVALRNHDEPSGRAGSVN
jgi:hypothetical protein